MGKEGRECPSLRPTPGGCFSWLSLEMALLYLQWNLCLPSLRKGSTCVLASRNLGKKMEQASVQVMRLLLTAGCFSGVKATCPGNRVGGTDRCFTSQPLMLPGLSAKMRMKYLHVVK